jgi:hypothetical protein
MIEVICQLLTLTIDPLVSDNTLDIVSSTITMPASMSNLSAATPTAATLHDPGDIEHKGGGGHGSGGKGGGKGGSSSPKTGGSGGGIIIVSGHRNGSSGSHVSASSWLLLAICFCFVTKVAGTVNVRHGELHTGDVGNAEGVHQRGRRCEELDL